MANTKGKPQRRDGLAGFSGVAQIFGAARPAGVEDLDDARSIKVGLLEPNPYQPRTTFDEAALTDLADDIRAHGILQPLLVRPHPTHTGRYQIVAGERRCRAAQRAGLEEVPCIERQMGDDAMERLALAENIQRTDLPAVDEARAYRRIIDTTGLSQRKLADAIHKDPEYIAQRLRLLDHQPIEEAVRSGVLGPTVGQELARVDDEETRQILIDRAVRGERVTVQDAKKARRPAKDHAPAPNNSALVEPMPVNPPPPSLPRQPPASPTTVPQDDASDGLQEALDGLASTHLAVVLQYGIARQWTCAQLWQTILEHQSAAHP